MKKDFTARVVGFSEAYDMAFKVAQKIGDSPVAFDVVVGVSRGGLPPARIVCDFLNIGTLTSLQIRHYMSGAEENEQVEVTDPIVIDIQGKHVLIVDDVNDSGKTLKSAHKHVQSKSPATVKTAVLHEKDNTSFRADFTGSHLSKWKWLIYQWAVTEDLLEFLNKDDLLNASKDEALQHLSKTYNLNIERDLFRKVIAMKENYFST